MAKIARLFLYLVSSHKFEVNFSLIHSIYVQTTNKFAQLLIMLNTPNLQYLHKVIEMIRIHLTKISFISILITILMINSCLHSSAATRDWYVGTSVKYAYILSESEKTTTIIDGLEGFDYYSAEMEIRFDIISIDSINHEFVANMTTADIGIFEYDGYTDAEVISDL